MSESDVVVSHYDTLGVSKDATQKEVKDAYITLTKKHHPDVSKGDETSTARISAINEAYMCLGDQSLRATYDEANKDPEFHKEAHQMPARHPNESDDSYDRRVKSDHYMIWYTHTLNDRSPNVKYARKMFFRDVFILSMTLVGIHILYLISIFDTDEKTEKMSYRNAYDDWRTGKTVFKNRPKDSYINQYFADEDDKK